MAKQLRGSGGRQRQLLLLVPGSLVLALLGLLGIMHVDSGGVSVISVSGAWARPATAAMPGTMPGMDHGITGTMMSGANSVAYLRIINSGGSDDSLIGASTEIAATIEFHRTTIKDNLASMRQEYLIVVPKHGEVRFAPGGYHMVLVNMRRDLHPGDSITVNLYFARAGTIVVVVPVRDE